MREAGGGGEGREWKEQYRRRGGACGRSEEGVGRGKV